MSDESRQPFLVSFGLGGHSVQGLHGGNECHTSGYDSPESFERELQAGRKEYGDLAHVPVLDKREVLRQSPSLAIRSPLVRVTLSDGHVEKLDKTAAARMSPGLEGSFASLAAVGMAHDESTGPGPLDHVSVADYVRWWVQNGARLGHMDDSGTRIIWNDEDDGARPEN